LIRLFVSFFFLLTSACSTTVYKGSGTIPLYVSPRSDNLQPFQLHGRHQFYWWGQWPRSIVTDLDQLVREDGHASAANLGILEYRTFIDWISSIASFGLYTPISYIVSGFGREDEDFSELRGERRWIRSDFQP
jgi:hypothetical protein